MITLFTWSAKPLYLAPMNRGVAPVEGDRAERRSDPNGMLAKNSFNYLAHEIKKMGRLYLDYPEKGVL